MTKQRRWGAFMAFAFGPRIYGVQPPAYQHLKQAKDLRDNTRLLVIHPYNPPHIMPLIEIVPSPGTILSEVDFARQYFSVV